MANKDLSSQSYVLFFFFSSSHDGCESWTIKKAGHQKIDDFELWCWRRLLRVPWTAGRSNQSIVKEISPDYSLEGLMLKLKLQYFGHLMWRANSLEKTLMLGKIEGKRRRGWQRMRWLNSITDSWIWANSETVKDREAWHAAVHGATKSWTRPSNWTTTKSPQQTTNISYMDNCNSLLTGLSGPNFVSDLSAHERRVICIKGQSGLCPWMQTFQYFHMLWD